MLIVSQLNLNLLGETGLIGSVGYHDATRSVPRVERLECAQGILGLSLVPQLHSEFLAVDSDDLHGEVTIGVLDSAGPRIAFFMLQELLNY